MTLLLAREKGYIDINTTSKNTRKDTKKVSEYDLRRSIQVGLKIG